MPRATSIQYSTALTQYLLGLAVLLLSLFLLSQAF